MLARKPTLQNDDPFAAKHRSKRSNSRMNSGRSGFGQQQDISASIIRPETQSMVESEMMSVRSDHTRPKPREGTVAEDKQPARVTETEKQVYEQSDPELDQVKKITPRSGRSGRQERQKKSK